MPNTQKNQRPIDEAAQEALSWWDKSFVFIKKTQVKTWQAVFITAFVAGAAVTLVWTVSNDYHPFSRAAVTSAVPANTCLVVPPGGYFSQATAVNIKCGSNVKNASYQWDNLGKPRSIGPKGINIKYPAQKDMTLKVYGQYKKPPVYGYGYGYSNKNFTLIYYFKVRSNITCTDSDGGENYYIKGEASSSKIINNNTTGAIDTCSGDILYEAYCGADGTAQQITYQCPNGCNDGACIASSTPETSLLYLGKDNVYYKCQGKPVTPQNDDSSENNEMSFDLKSVKILSDKFFTDKNGVYFIGTFNYYCYFYKLNDADPATFKVLNKFYNKDKNYAYYNSYENANPDLNNKIENANAPTFRLSEKGDEYAIDKNYLYYKGKIISTLKTPSNLK